MSSIQSLLMPCRALIQAAISFDKSRRLSALWPWRAIVEGIVHRSELDS